MKENTKEKSLVQVNKNSLFYKIKSFFKNLFHKNEKIDNNVIIEKNTCSNVESEIKQSDFMERIKNIENEETKLLKLQKKYRRGEIKEEDLTEEQITSLCTLYDSQIARLKKSNAIRKQKILNYRKKMQTET